MDKIPLQTVYVPVAVTGYDFTGKPSVPMISLAGMVSQEYTDKARKKNTWRILDQQDNRIVLTKQELGQMLLDVLILASEGTPLSPDGKNHLINQFFKAHGI